MYNYGYTIKRLKKQQRLASQDIFLTEVMSEIYHFRLVSQGSHNGMTPMEKDSYTVRGNTRLDLFFPSSLLCRERFFCN